MNPQDAIDFSREALKTCMMVGGPILVASLLIGLLVGVFQAITQVQDQTVSFVPKILLLLLMIGLCLPWLCDRMLAFAKQSFEKPMTQWAGASPPRLFPKANENSDSPPTQPVSFTTAKDFTAMPSLKSQPSQKQDSKLPAMIAAPFKRTLPSPSATADNIAPVTSPFILPHYRMSKASPSEIGN